MYNTVIKSQRSPWRTTAFSEGLAAMMVLSCCSMSLRWFSDGSTSLHTDYTSQNIQIHKCVTESKPVLYKYFHYFKWDKHLTVVQARPSSPPSLSLLETQTRIINIPANTKIIQLQYFSLALNIWRVGASFNSSPAGRITFVIYSRQRAPLAELGTCGRGNREPRGHRETSRGQAQGDVAGCDELIRLQLSNGGPLGGIGMQHPFDEGGRCWVDVLHEDNCRLSWYDLNKKKNLCIQTFFSLKRSIVLNRLTQGMV